MRKTCANIAKPDPQDKSEYDQVRRKSKQKAIVAAMFARAGYDQAFARYMKQLKRAA